MLLDSSYSAACVPFRFFILVLLFSEEERILVSETPLRGAAFLPPLLDSLCWSSTAYAVFFVDYISHIAGEAKTNTARNNCHFLSAVV